jgi:hypothetical protein
MGIFEFIFGKGAPKEENAPKQAFYLNDDDAKSFGNIEYMRSTKTVKRTFAKKKGETEHMESIRQISATKASVVSDNNRGMFNSTPQSSFSSSSFNNGASSGASTSNTSTPATPQPPALEAPPRRKPSSNDMDMFRNMAKDIRK